MKREERGEEGQHERKGGVVKKEERGGLRGRGERDREEFKLEKKDKEM